jgi:hypothetical protein
MKTHSLSLRRIGGLAAALTLSASPALAEGLDYTYNGEFFAGSFLDALLLDGLDFQVQIRADTTAPDSDPGNTDRGEFSGPFTAFITIEGLGTYRFLNPVAAITERVDGGGFQPVEARATFAGGSTSSMTGFSPDTITPYFGDPNLLDPFPGGANVVVADFNAEPLRPVGGVGIFTLSGQSPGGSVFATPTPDVGSSAALLAAATASLALWRRRPAS